jgi:hypothetical protein
MDLLDIPALYRSRSCSRQWTGFLNALATEFSAALSDEELFTLMVRIGGRFAGGQPLAACADLSQVAAQANRIWEGTDWGRCQMREYADHVEILHAGAPIQIALGGAEWGDGFLQGVYGAWFQQLGMLPGLSVSMSRAESQDVRRLVLAKAI